MFEWEDLTPLFRGEPILSEQGNIYFYDYQTLWGQRMWRLWDERGVGHLDRCGLIWLLNTDYVMASASFAP